MQDMLYFVNDIMRIDAFELGGLTTGGTILTAERLVAVFTVAHVYLVVRKGMDPLPKVVGAFPGKGLPGQTGG